MPLWSVRFDGGIVEGEHVFNRHILQDRAAGTQDDAAIALPGQINHALHVGAHRERRKQMGESRRNAYAARLSVTMGRFRWPPTQATSSFSRTPGAPLTSVTGLAHAEARGQRGRSSKRG